MKILVKILIFASIVELENVTAFLKTVFLERSESFCKTFVKLEQAMKQREKMVVERNLQTSKPPNALL